jgi:hypothetical protein
VRGDIRTGFGEYLSTGKYTEAFISDVNMIIGKIYRHWSLYVDEEEFSDSCWAKVVRSLQIYDEQNGRSIGPLSTYLFAVISNEAQRLYSKHKKMVAEDVVNFPDLVPMWGAVSNDFDFVLRDRLCSFARLSYRRGVYVNQASLYHNYLLGNNSPAVKAFMWSSLLGLI